MEALPWSRGKTQLIITSRYPFVLESKGVEWVSKGLERLSLMSLHGSDLRKKLAYMDHLMVSPYARIYQKLSGGNPRLLEWIEKLVGQGASPEINRLEADLHEQTQNFIQTYLAEIMVAAQELDFGTFLAKAAVYSRPVTADAFAALGPPVLLDRAVDLALMEREGNENPVYWVLPLIRDHFWAQVSDGVLAHKCAYDWYDAKVRGTERFDYVDEDACLSHAEAGYGMKGCWAHAVRLSNHFFNTALVREGVTRLLPLKAYLDGKGETDHGKLEVVFLNNLAQLLKAINRLAEAEPLMKRALTIAKKAVLPVTPTFKGSKPAWRRC